MKVNRSISVDVKYYNEGIIDRINNAYGSFSGFVEHYLKQELELKKFEEVETPELEACDYCGKELNKSDLLCVAEGYVCVDCYEALNNEEEVQEKLKKDAIQAKTDPAIFGLPEEAKGWTLSEVKTVLSELDEFEDYTSHKKEVQDND